MALTPAERASRKREQLIETARKYSTSTYSRKFVAPIYQKMLRAEYATLPAGLTPAVVKGELTQVFREIGQVVCVTCGKVTLWSTHHGAMQTGHFLPSRRNSILYEEDNCQAQCVLCNQHLGGAVEDYTVWMNAVRGSDTVDRLRKLKEVSRRFERDELVDMRIGFAARLKAAEEKMT